MFNNNNNNSIAEPPRFYQRGDTYPARASSPINGGNFLSRPYTAYGFFPFPAIPPYCFKTLHMHGAADDQCNIPSGVNRELIES